MPKLGQFDPPAFQNDFIAGEESQQKALRARWSDNINRFTYQTFQNRPWDATNQPTLTEYFDLLDVDVPAGTVPAPIRWTAFPRRIQTTFPDVGQRQQWEKADNGTGDPKYDPKGPRGWQDEYCEWSVTRNAQNKITSVMFTCENREYWYTLWQIDPSVVLRIYRQLVGPQVKMDDLVLHDESSGNPVIEPETGRPAYNDRNPWNSTTTNGAVHLISAPNALSAEIFLAGQATILRQDGQGNPITDKDQLINCSQYGTSNRNSDPTIGAGVNSLVRGTGGAGTGLRVTLSNPVGLYIQTPDFSTFQLPFTAPAGAQPSDYWKVVRGRVKQGNEPIDFILHAVYEVPEDQGFTVGDITVDGFPIDFASQITQKFQVALAGLGLPQVGPPPGSLACSVAPPDPLPKPLPLPRPSVLGDLASLPSLGRSGLNMRIEQGSTATNIALVASDSDPNATIDIVGGPGVTVTKTGFQKIQDVPLFLLQVTAAPDAPLGDRSLGLTNSDGKNGPPVYGLLEVVPPGTLARGVAPIPAPAALSPESPHLGIVRPLSRSMSRSR
jgi:hypothetical protein